jgi:CDP-glucose 4,6-dehydratase
MVSHLHDAGAAVVAFGRKQLQAGILSPDVVNSRRITIVRGDVRDRVLIERTLQEFSVDAVFHLAAQSKVQVAQQDPTETFEVNVEGTWNVLEAVRRTGRKIGVLIASSDMVYGESDGAPSTEASFTRGSSPYAASKLCAELLAKCYHEGYGVSTAIARTSNVYGGGDFNFERIVPSTIRAVMRGEAPTINSSGRPERDYLYVGDAVAGYARLASSLEDKAVSGETFNFSSGTPVSVSAIVEMILRLMERTDLNPRVLGQCTNEISTRHSSPAKAIQVLGWRPETSLESGLKKTISWFQAHANEACAEAHN